MSEKPGDKIIVEPQCVKPSGEETIEITTIPDQTTIIVELLSRTYGANTAESFKICRPFFRDKEITDEAKQLIIEALKKRPSLVTITLKVIEDLPEIIARYLVKIGYDVKSPKSPETVVIEILSNEKINEITEILIYKIAPGSKDETVVLCRDASSDPIGLILMVLEDEPDIKVSTKTLDDNLDRIQVAYKIARSRKQIRASHTGNQER
jgi:hypothetical protein